MISIARLMREGRFELRTRDEARSLARFLAHCGPPQPLLELALLELMLNAVEHGNLEIGGRLKCELLEGGGFETEIARRLALADLGMRMVRVQFVQTTECTTYVIADEGAGFSWQAGVSEGQPSTRPCGRGLELLRVAGVELTFNSRGNIAALRMPW